MAAERDDLQGGDATASCLRLDAAIAQQYTPVPLPDEPRPAPPLHVLRERIASRIEHEVGRLRASGWRLTAEAARNATAVALNDASPRMVGILIVNGTLHVTTPLPHHGESPYLQLIEDLRRTVARHGRSFGNVELFLNFDDHPQGIVTLLAGAAVPSDASAIAKLGISTFSINGVLMHDQRTARRVCQGQRGGSAVKAGWTPGGWAAKARNLIIPWHYNSERTCVLRTCRDNSWRDRSRTLFARYTHHNLGVVTGRSADGRPLPSVARTYFAWLAQNTSGCRGCSDVRLDVGTPYAMKQMRGDPYSALANGSRMGKVPFERHCTARYLLNTDGRTASNFAGLLGAGGVVLKHRSIYFQYFEHALEPWVHFVPIWVESKDDALAVLRHLEARPELAAAIAFNGRAAACGLLQRSHHVDYWRALLSAYAPLMAFTVDEGVVAERRAQRQQRQGQERARAASRPSGGLSPAAAARLAGAAMNSTQRLAAHLRALRANVAAAERAAALHRRTAAGAEMSRGCYLFIEDRCYRNV